MINGKRNKILVLIFFSCTIFSCSVKKTLHQNNIFKTSEGRSVPYQCFKPKFQSDTKQPLILFLHGAGERGNDNRKQLVHVVPYLTSDSFQQKHPCFILAPQCPEEGYWAPVKRFEWSVIQNGEITKSMEGVLELLDNILKTSGIDKERIYMVGLSMGGFGVFDLAARRPEIFAAGVPICGGGDLQKIDFIKRTPLWIFHGGKDSVVSVEKSREMYKAINNSDNSSLFTEYEGQNHGIWEMAIREPGLWEWVFSQKKIN